MMLYDIITRVIPAKAGIQRRASASQKRLTQHGHAALDSRLRGNDSVLVDGAIRNAILAALVCLCLLGAVTPAAARTTPTFGQSEVGQPCGRLVHNTDFDTLVQCTSSAADMSSGTKQTAPIIVGTVTAPPYAVTTCDASKAGMLQWTGTYFQGCDGTTWYAFAGATGAAPNAFSFTDQTGVGFSKNIVSNAVALAGFAGLLPAACNTGCTGIYRNGIWAGVTANFAAGDTIAIQQTSSSSATTATTASVKVGSTVSGTWTVTTGATSGNTPNAFSFTDITNANLGTTVASNAVQLLGFTGTLTATCGTGCTNIAKNGVWQGATTVAGFYPGNTITIQQTSAATINTPSTAQVTVGTTTSSTWTVTTAATSDACDGTPALGTMCADGTLYAGLSPDGSVKMYVTPCDAGMSWSGSACTGSRVVYTWNDGSTNYSVTGFTSTTTGRANTTGLVALGSSPSPAPYQAALYCDNLTANSHGDWYLPAKDELNLMYIISNNGTANGFASGVYYWSSSENNSTYAWYQRFSDGNQVYNGKNYSYPVRCARR